MATISRRSFFEVMAGSIVSLPVLAGGLIVGPTTALAEESEDEEAFDYDAFDDMDTGKDAPAKYTIIDVVRPYEVGFIAVDVTQVRHVRKAPGGLPGMVFYTDYETVVAEADEALVQRLMQK